MAAILTLVSSIISALATMLRSVIDLIPWSNPIVWCVICTVAGCEYGRQQAIEQVNKRRHAEERPVINHPFRPWLGVSEAEGDEIQPNYEWPAEENASIYEQVPAEPPKIEAKPVSKPASVAACSPQGSGLRAVRPVRNVLRRLFKR